MKKKNIKNTIITVTANSVEIFTFCKKIVLDLHSDINLLEIIVRFIFLKKPYNIEGFLLFVGWLK
jgi:hypothetical protein